MITISPKRKKAPLPVAIFLSALLTLPILTACGGGSQNAAPPPPVNDSVGRNVNNPAPGNQPQEAKKGLSTGQKVGITLVGAAALYYLYNQRMLKQRERKASTTFLRTGVSTTAMLKVAHTGYHHLPEEFKFRSHKRNSTGISKDITGVKQVAL
jgi:hypothetical protein